MRDSGVFVIGAGGHAKVVIATLEASGRMVRGVFDDRLPPGALVLGAPVMGTLAQAMEFLESEAVVAIGANETRRAIVRQLAMRWITAVHPRAFVHSSVRLGPGTVVLAGAVIQPDAQIGSHVILSTAATVDHDCTVGDFVHLAPGTHLAGNVRIGEGAFLGIGSVVLPGLAVGNQAVIGAGSVVVRDVACGLVVAGVPASLLEQKPDDTREYPSLRAIS